MSAFKKIANIQDIEDAALKKLDRNVLDYYGPGAQDNITNKDNKLAYDRYQLCPRVLRDVSNVDMSVSIFGHTFKTPVFVAASAMQKMANPIGEAGAARSACKNGAGYSLSTVSTTSLEDISKSVAPLESQGHQSVRWFQLYVYKDRLKSLDLIKRAENAGFTALLVTADTPYLGRRLANIRHGFMLPDHLRLANFDQGEGDSAKKDSNYISKYISDQIDPSLSWKDLKWLKTQTKLPILVKGVLTAEDAKLVVENGLDGIVVSNHGGRQLDGVSATIDALDEVVQAVDNKIPVLIDGGVMRGSDVFKALALGAKAVFVGRPVLWSLALDGEKGVDLMFDILNEELRLTMALSGVSNVSQIDKSYIKPLATRSKL
ncbi:hypothetical protein BB561_006102 [Smittium simulii]|uniref:Oxidase FUB9 n=1 Tax=Smittium simulii TaxID=133385 RepID=A0A2T9Y6I7_9FUNG|nr:hypothetical protein BB561_006102 [Smittium simulii]